MFDFVRHTVGVSTVTRYLPDLPNAASMDLVRTRRRRLVEELTPSC